MYWRMGHQDCEVWEVEKQPGLASQCAVYSRGFEITLLARKKEGVWKKLGAVPLLLQAPKICCRTKSHPHGTLWQYSCPTLLGEPHHLLQHLLLGSTRVG